MKTERLYAITVYLLNHGRTSASELAKHFEVSLRTIQRDMDSLCLAGIPVISIAGAAGGYEISDRFMLDKQYATANDYSHILTALRGFASATMNPKVKHTLEKIARVSKPDDCGIVLDFSVLQEGDSQVLQLLQSAVAIKHTVEFLYTNNNNETRIHNVEPIAVIYRWYAWYLLAYSKVKSDYRTYKLVRMRNLKITDIAFVREHASAEDILKRMDQSDTRIYTEILIKCTKAAKMRIVEYLKGTIIQELSDGGALIKATIVENEQFWMGNLLSLGDEAEIIAPEEIRSRLLDAAEKIVSLYKKL
ncbi:MAG: YafY family transcriptional regulator [Lachnospiraceae bacterium]|nr:YafY family transcriptional regulator [Lachnospiraceae bacterium]MDE6184367.1 YafY family transcriptional regulator [Lachnospiraceae bacterium]